MGFIGIYWDLIINHGNYHGDSKYNNGIALGEEYPLCLDLLKDPQKRIKHIPSRFPKQWIFQ